MPFGTAITWWPGEISITEVNKEDWLTGTHKMYTAGCSSLNPPLKSAERDQVIYW